MSPSFSSGLLLSEKSVLAGWCIYALVNRYHITIHSIFLAFSAPEIGFAIYQHYLIFRVSRYYPEQVLAPYERLQAQHDVFHADLRPKLTSTKSGNLLVTYTNERAVGADSDPESSVQRSMDSCQDYRCSERALKHEVAEIRQDLQFRKKYGTW